ncbi:MAG: ATP-binding protein, partial [Sphingomonas bacterium]|nr:ATP-binding protein [Sphingomonas bacterium]
MNDEPNLQQFVDKLSSYSDEGLRADGGAVPTAGDKLPSIGIVREIAGSGSCVSMDAAMLHKLATSPDLSVSMAGQVGSQIKMQVANAWLIANVRTMRAGEPGEVVANVDFLGEGQLASSGRMVNFRRGVTRYPIPGSPIYPVNTDDMRSIFAADDSPHIEIGTVYPTDDIRGTLYVDPMLSKHFAVLGSTGTGKSTAVALILHRISQLS